MTYLSMALMVLSAYAGWKTVDNYIFKKRHHTEFHKEHQYTRICMFCRREAKK